MTLASPSTCRHCGITFRWTPVTSTTDSGAILFCCRGCLGAYELISSSGLAEFYSRMTIPPPSVDSGFPEEFSDQCLAEHIEPAGRYCRIRMLIGSIRCPSCIWLIERILAKDPGLQNIAVNYSTNVASITFDPELSRPSEFFKTVSRLGYLPKPYTPASSEDAALREKNDLMIRLGTAFFLTMQLMAYSVALYAGYFQGISDGMKQLLQYVSLLVTAPVILYCGLPFLKGAWRDLRSGMYGMDLLIATGSLSAFAYSVYALLTSGETYFESAAMIITFVLTGRLLELSTRRTASSGISALMSAAPQTATLMKENDLSIIKTSDIRPGDTLLIRQGERFPVDCLIIEGESDVDQSMLTGESMPVTLSPGKEARGGSLNISSPLTVNAISALGQSFVMRIAGLVQDAQCRKPKIQQMADRMASRFVPAVMLLSIATYIWKSHGGEKPSQALMSALAVLLIACPCSVGLAVPSAVHAACASGIRRGIIFRGGDVFERLSSISALLFDKTGILTEGKPRVVSMTTVPGFTPDDVLACAAGIEALSPHPIGSAICRYAMERGIDSSPAAGFRQIPGRGISGMTSDDREILCGNRMLLEGHDIVMGGTDEPFGFMQMHVAIGGKHAASFLLEDPLRPDVPLVPAAMKSRGIPSSILSGDEMNTVSRIAGECAIDDFHAGLLPEDKLNFITSLRKRGEHVLMAGDGINDAPSLAAADVGCSISGSTELALEQADMVITGGSLDAIVTGYDLSRRTMTVIRQNLIWASVYNIIGIPLAMSGLLTPVYAAAAMTASSLMVSFNSLRLTR